MAITAELVKTLRERSGAAMMDCKRALEAAGGDIEAAMDALRKQGAAKADKKSSRTTAEGVVVAKSNDAGAILVEINSETDFVARDENFKNFAEQVATAALEARAEDVNAIANLKVAGSSDTIELARQQLIAKIGENITVRRAIYIAKDDHIGAYVHSGRIGVLVNMKSGSSDLAKDVAMHIAASAPLVINPSEVSQDYINKEREIFTAQAKESGKPADIIEKMIQGRINKYLDEVSLLGQPFVKDPNTKVGQLLKSANATVTKFVRIEVGEGIEKKQDNFVDEVMAQVRESSS